MTARDLAYRVAVLDALNERVSDALRTARAELNVAMVTGDRLTVTAQDVVLASITKAKGRVSARISDPARLLAWVDAHYPGEVVADRKIRPAFAAVIISDSKSAGVPCVRGELDVPGLSVTESEPTVSLRPAEGCAAAVERLWRAGVIDLRSLLALPGGE